MIKIKKKQIESDKPVEVTLFLTSLPTVLLLLFTLNGRYLIASEFA